MVQIISIYVTLVVAIHAIFLTFSTRPISVILSAVAFIVPVLLSAKPIIFYDGHDSKANARTVAVKKLSYIIISQSIPLACLVTLSFTYLIIWAATIIVVFLAIRRTVTSILATMKKGEGSPYSPTLALYHPHAHQRAGGEMVLWRLVHALAQSEEFYTLFDTFSKNRPTSAKFQPQITILTNTVPESFLLSAIQSNKEKKNQENDDNTHSNLQNTLKRHNINDQNDDFLFDLINELAKSTNITKSSEIKPTQQDSAILPFPPLSYTNDFITKQIVQSTSKTFGIDLDSQLYQETTKKYPKQSRPNLSLSFLFSPLTAFSDAEHYPRLTLVLQTINAIYPLLDLILTHILATPSTKSANQPFPVFILDTAGYPITALLSTVLGIPSGSYVHYPVIQADMLRRNLTGELSIRAENQLKSSPSTLALAKRILKHYYFMIVLHFYVILISCNKLLFANGTWTYNHLINLLDMHSTVYIKELPEFSPKDEKIDERGTKPMSLSKLYPPCNLPLNATKSPETTVNCAHINHIHPIFTVLGQYRPEKQQMLVIKAFEDMLKNRCEKGLPLYISAKGREMPISLVFIGTYRPTDYNLVKNMLDYITSKKIHLKTPSNQITTINLSDHVKCLFNIDLLHLQHILSHSLCGVHAMIDEHFGIGVVELMFNCYTVIGHRSAGPKLDIIVPPIDTPKLSQNNNAVGYLASTPDEYTTMMFEILDLYTRDIKHISTCTPLLGGECDYASPLQAMSIRAQTHALNSFSVDVFDHNIDCHLVNQIKPYFLSERSSVYDI